MNNSTAIEIAEAITPQESKAIHKSLCEVVASIGDQLGIDVDTDMVDDVQRALDLIIAHEHFQLAAMVWVAAYVRNNKV